MHHLKPIFTTASCSRHHIYFILYIKNLRLKNKIVEICKRWLIHTNFPWDKLNEQVMVFYLNRFKPLHIFNGKTVPTNILFWHLAIEETLNFMQYNTAHSKVGIQTSAFLLTILNTTFSTSKPCPTNQSIPCLTVLFVTKILTCFPLH